MRTLWILLLIVLASLAGAVTQPARACDLQGASGRACDPSVLAPAGVQAALGTPAPCGPVAADPVSNDAGDDPDGSDQGPERVDSDAVIGNTIGLDGPLSSEPCMRVEPEPMPDSRSQDRTQQPPRN